MSDIDDCARRCIALDKALKTVATKTTTLKKQLSEEKEKLMSLMKEGGIKGLNFDEGSVTASRLLGASVKDENEFLDWCTRNDVDVNAYKTWSGPALRGLMIEQVDNGTPLPNGVEGYEGVSLRFKHREKDA